MIDEDKISFLYRKLIHLEYLKFTDLISSNIFQLLHNNHIHHIAFIVPYHFNMIDFKKTCIKYCVHEKFNSILGCFEHNKIRVELIKPLSKDSILGTNYNLDVFKFDHLCFYFDSLKIKNKIKITQRIYTQLFNTYISFDLVQKKYKIEIIYEE